MSVDLDATVEPLNESDKFAIAYTRFREFYATAYNFLDTMEDKSFFVISILEDVSSDLLFDGSESNLNVYMRVVNAAIAAAAGRKLVSTQTVRISDRSSSDDPPISVH